MLQAGRPLASQTWLLPTHHAILVEVIIRDVVLGTSMVCTFSSRPNRPALPPHPHRRQPAKRFPSATNSSTAFPNPPVCARAQSPAKPPDCANSVRPSRFPNFLPPNFSLAAHLSAPSLPADHSSSNGSFFRKPVFFFADCCAVSGLNRPACRVGVCWGRAGADGFCEVLFGLFGSHWGSLSL